MRLHSERLNVEKGGILQESEFKIKATAKAFNILSSALYSDKILAIVRELSCNAWDAHVAAKNTKKQFEIKLPTSLDPTFYVKDYGIGLSHEEVLELYTTYFDSSKSDSNDYIGALGLGSKSPFSYVPTFSVESRFNGTKRVYSAFIGENGVPSIALMGKEKTDEDNGLTVSLGTKTGDADKWRLAARKALMYFKDQTPNIIGGGANFKPYELSYSVTGTNWKLRQTEYGPNMRGAYVVQGFVAYPIDADILAQNGLSRLGQQILGLDIDLSVKIGDVEVAASREALSYTKATIANLSKSVEVAAKEMRASIQKEFDKCKSSWDAKMLYCQLHDYNNKTHTLFNELHRAQPFTYNKQPVKDEFILDVSKIKQTGISVSYLPSYRSKPTRSTTWDPSTGRQNLQFSIHDGMTVLVDDVYGSTGILTQYLEANKHKSGNTYVLVLKATSKNAYDSKEIDAILKALDNPPFQYVSSLPYTKAKGKYTYRARKSDQFVKWTGYPKNGGWNRDKLRRVYSRLCWTNINADPQDTKTERFYVELERFTITNSGKDVEYFDLFLDYCQTIGIFSDKLEVIGVNEKQAARAKANKAWHNVFEYANNKFAEMNKTNILTNAVISSGVMDHIGNGIAKHIVMDWPNLRKNVVDGSFKKSLDAISAVYEASKTNKHKIETINNVANYVNSSFAQDVKTKFAALTEEFTEMLGKHSMLRLVNWEKVGAKDVGMILDYANFVAKKK